MAAEKLTFRVTVNDKGEFEFDPPGDWGYVHDSHLRFVSGSGPFSIRFRNKAGLASKNYRPLGDVLEARGPGPEYSCETDIKDPLKPPERRMLVGALGFIAQFYYEITVTKNGTAYTHVDHNGTYHC